MLAMELQIAVSHQGTRQQAGFGQHLEAIADPEHQPAVVGKLFYRLHDRTESGDGAAAKIIAVAEATRNDYCVGVTERVFLVPNVARRVAKQPGGMNGILIAVGCWKL